jgi:aldehyde:ferredoxin oxidoreductase
MWQFHGWKDVKRTAVSWINLVVGIFIKNSSARVRVFDFGAHALSDQEIKVRAVFAWLRTFRLCPFHQYAMKPKVLPERWEHLHDHATGVEATVIDVHNISTTHDFLECMLPQEQKP